MNNPFPTGSEVVRIVGKTLSPEQRTACIEGWNQAMEDWRRTRPEEKPVSINAFSSRSIGLEPFFSYFALVLAVVFTFLTYLIL